MRGTVAATAPTCAHTAAGPIRGTGATRPPIARRRRRGAIVSCLRSCPRARAATSAAPHVTTRREHCTALAACADMEPDTFKPTIEQTACVACGAATHDSALARLRKHLGQEIETAQKGLRRTRRRPSRLTMLSADSLKRRVHVMTFDMCVERWNVAEIARPAYAYENSRRPWRRRRCTATTRKALLELQAKIAPMEAELDALDQAAEADSATQAHLDRLRQLLGEKVATLQEAMTSHVTGMAASDQRSCRSWTEINAEKAEGPGGERDPFIRLYDGERLRLARRRKRRWVRWPVSYRTSTGDCRIWKRGRTRS